MRAAGALGQDPVSPEFRNGMFQEIYFSTDKARALLEWKPQKRLPVTLFEFMKWYKRKLIRNDIG